MTARTKRPTLAAYAATKPPKRKPRASTPMLAPSWSASTHSSPPMRAVTGHVVAIDLPIRTESEMNGSDEKRYVTTRRKVSQRNAVEIVMHSAACHLDRVKSHLWPPLRITLTRIGPVRMDCDNAVSSHKAVRDSVALWLGLDDGIDSIAWVYRREIAKTYGVRVEIRTGSAIVAEIDAEHSRAMAWYRTQVGAATAPGVGAEGKAER